MIKAGEDVKDIDENKTTSIETVIQCRPLVDWLRSNVKGMLHFTIFDEIRTVPHGLEFIY